MENYRHFSVVATKDNVRYVLSINATTKWHAIDIAYYKYTDYLKFQCANVVRTRMHSPNAIQWCNN